MTTPSPQRRLRPIDYNGHMPEDTQTTDDKLDALRERVNELADDVRNLTAALERHAARVPA